MSKPLDVGVTLCNPWLYSDKLRTSALENTLTMYMAKPEPELKSCLSYKLPLYYSGYREVTGDSVQRKPEKRLKERHV